MSAVLPVVPSPSLALLGLPSQHTSPNLTVCLEIVEPMMDAAANCKPGCFVSQCHPLTIHPLSPFSGPPCPARPLGQPLCQSPADARDCQYPPTQHRSPTQSMGHPLCGLSPSRRQSLCWLAQPGGSSAHGSGRRPVRHGLLNRCAIVGCCTRRQPIFRRHGRSSHDAADGIDDGLAHDGTAAAGYG